MKPKTPGQDPSGQNSETSRIPWHSAFVVALQLELDAYSNVLEFHAEYQLAAEPLKIDCVVIKKAKNVVITKNIAAIFRDANLLEYKSPDSYVSVPDFYKVYGYACLYAYIENVPISSLTITFVESHYPRKLLRYLQEERGFSVEERSPGIYTVGGDIVPIQVIDSRRLKADENLWLKSLSDKLDAKEVKRIGEEAVRQEKAARIQAYLNVITLANVWAIREAIKMRKVREELTLDQVFIETGYAARWEARGEAKGITEGLAKGKESEALAIAQNMINLGYPIEATISVTNLDPEKVRELYQGTENK